MESRHCADGCLLPKCVNARRRGLSLKTLLVLGSFIALSACTANHDPHNAIMDRIEQQVVLPSGAAPIASYSKYYSDAGHGTVQAAYVIHEPAFRHDVQNWCASGKARSFPCSGDGKSELAAAGERMWLPDAREVPLPSGGGCAAITFHYEPSTNVLSPARCNGPY